MESFITDTMESLGYVGVFLLMVLENIIPPIPSEVVMPSAGASARSGEKSLTLMILAGTMGTMIGSLPWYGVARWIGENRLERWVSRHGHWIGTTPSEMQRATEWFERSGRWVVLFGRLIPGIRTLVGIPAGLASMRLSTYLVATLIGTAAWSALLALLGYWLQGQSDVVADVLKYIGMGVIAILAILYAVKIIRTKRKKSRQSASS